jgi:hypothetical protein
MDLASPRDWYKYKHVVILTIDQSRAESEQNNSIQQQHSATALSKVSQQSTPLDPITHKIMSNRQAQIQREETRLQRGIFSPAEPISGLSLWWYDKTDFSNQPDVKARSEAVVRNHAPLRATEAWIR